MLPAVKGARKTIAGCTYRRPACAARIRPGGFVCSRIAVAGIILKVKIFSQFIAAVCVCANQPMKSRCISRIITCVVSFPICVQVIAYRIKLLQCIDRNKSRRYRRSQLRNRKWHRFAACPKRNCRAPIPHSIGCVRYCYIHCSAVACAGIWRNTRNPVRSFGSSPALAIDCKLNRIVGPCACRHGQFICAQRHRNSRLLHRKLCSVQRRLAGFAGSACVQH